MKKIYLLLFCTTITSFFISQGKSDNYIKSISSSEKNPLIIHQQLRSSPIWSNDFSNASKWVIANSTLDNQDWVISNVSDPNIGYGTGSWEDVTNITNASNGYALYDSDIIGVQGGTQDATITFDSVFDFSNNQNLVIQFNQRGRMWQTTETLVEVSNDNGNSWNSFPVNTLEPLSVLFENIAEINISSAAGGQSSVKIRLRYVGSWDYAWMVDNISIISQPEYDIQTITAYISGENNSGVEYGRTPQNQVDSNYFIGAQIFNFGALDNTNVIMTSNFVSFGTTDSVALINSDSTITIESLESLTFNKGIYEGDFLAVSDQEDNSSNNYSNNLYKRNFEITENIYSIDGIGNHPSGYDKTSSLGTASFDQGEDGLILASLYHVKQNDQISGLRVMLSSATVPGGEILISIKDTAKFWAEDMSSIIFGTNPSVVNQLDIDQGYIDIFFDKVESLPIGIYYACVELYSFTNLSDIRVIDDQTVPQPYDASAIYIGGTTSTSYSNGTAFGIRMLMGNNWSVSLEETQNNKFSIYPNPSNGEFNVAANSNELSDLTVKDITGKIVISKVFSSNTIVNLNNYAKGVYVVEIKNKKGIFTQKIFLQ
jgi:hypothetical protein